MIWWYNIIRDKKGSISYLLRLETITAGYVLIDNNLVAPKRSNHETILTEKITEWGNFTDYFGLSIEADPYRVGKKSVYFPIVVI